MTQPIDKFIELYKAESNSIYFKYPDYSVVFEDEWQQDGKYQSASHIVLFEGQHFQVQEGRSGSYHTDWYYTETYVSPVTRHEETKVVVSWKPDGPALVVPERY